MLPHKPGEAGEGIGIDFIREPQFLVIFPAGHGAQQMAGQSLEALGILAQQRFQLLLTFLPKAEAAQLAHSTGEGRKIQLLFQLQYSFGYFPGHQNVPAKVFQCIHGEPSLLLFFIIPQREKIARHQP